MNYSKTASKIRGKLKEFSGNICNGLSKPIQRFVGEMVYGITARQSVLLSEVVRSLDENIPEIKTENRLTVCRALEWIIPSAVVSCAEG